MWLRLHNKGRSVSVPSKYSIRPGKRQKSEKYFTWIIHDSVSPCASLTASGETYSCLVCVCVCVCVVCCVLSWKAVHWQLQHDSESSVTFSLLTVVGSPRLSSAIMILGSVQNTGDYAVNLIFCEDVSRNPVKTTFGRRDTHRTNMYTAQGPQGGLCALHYNVCDQSVLQLHATDGCRWNVSRVAAGYLCPNP